MAIQTRFFTMDGKEGVDLNNIEATFDATTLPEVPGRRHNLGDRVQGNNGSEWMYVVASATVTAFNWIAINRNFGAQNATTAIQASGIFVFGIAEFQAISTDQTSLLNAQPGQNFWALMKAAHGARVNVSATISVGPGAKLFVSQDIPGTLTTSTTSSTSAMLQIVGLFVAASATNGVSLSASQTNVEVGMYTYPYPAVLASVQAASV